MAASDDEKNKYVFFLEEEHQKIMAEINSVLGRKLQTFTQ